MNDDNLLNTIRDTVHANTPSSPNRDKIRQDFLTSALALKGEQQSFTSKSRFTQWRQIPQYINRPIPIFSFVGIILLAVGTVLAQNVISIFNQVDNDEFRITLIYGSGGQQDLNRPISIDQAQAMVDYPIHVPTFMPDAYQLQEIYHWDEDDRLSLHYQCGSYRQIILQLIPLDHKNITDLSRKEVGLLDVGVSATVETVEIGDVTGQYVRGAWVSQQNPNIVVTQVDGEWVRIYRNNKETVTLMPGDEFQVESYWENNSELQRMFWLNDGILYMLVNIGSRIDYNTAGDCVVNKNIYMAIANSLKLVD